jgi:hypothetical protein
MLAINLKKLIQLSIVFMSVSIWYSPLSRQKTTKVKIERCVVKRQAKYLHIFPPVKAVRLFKMDCCRSLIIQGLVNPFIVIEVEVLP